ncbi:MAG: hypothetical protein J6T99_05140 [Oscillospiraceae bacterium]|nr:hypothetical protein [Oscillospiraceae bacterium]
METVTMEQLLQAEEEKIRGEIRADTTVDQDRMQSVSRLKETLAQALLRYNAANSGNQARQAIADSMTAAIQDACGFLLAGTAEKEISNRPIRAGAIISLLCSVICCLSSLLLFAQKVSFLFGCILMVLAIFLAFLSGRLWYGEREVHVRTGLDADTVWKTLKKTSATMDRKIDRLCELEDARILEARNSAGESQQKISTEELNLLGDLLEGLYSDNGEFSLRQLRKIKPYLQHQGIELEDYTANNAEMFDILPSKKEAVTLRPALLEGETLLLAGKATELER